ncbi:DNA-binding domain-containing protein [Sulfitobacter sp. S190]|uniref:DNA-binding domain-containing protein n=1 Tax=Sulfitobacter sp. S190 TaxID=2867022 RepID=UPI0021A42D0F|nr:DNA-binding domain-containing protein [Sulfitobacter sp. S190]UWR21470.1 DNA-binding domain-containing protein [Sulfitobacter sp. S190]
MTASQRQFRAALLDAEAAVPDGLLDCAGAPAGRRYGVYRNNVVVSLIEAMKTAFPTVRTLLGSQNFDGLAPIFVRQHPPSSPLMMHYGAEFPGFLQGVSQLSHLGYLPDVARLDLAMRQSYHAADPTPFDVSVLEQPPEELSRVYLALAPPVRIIRSRWPLFDIWQKTQDPQAAAPRNIAQDIMIARPEFDPAPYLLPPGAAVWLSALVEHDLGTALEMATAADPDFDFAAALTLALQTQALTTKTKDA